MSTDSKSNKDTGISHSHFSHNDNENKGNNNIINLDNNNINYVNNEVKEIVSHTESKFKNKYSGGFKSYKIRDNNILKGFTFEYSTELSKYTIDRKLLRNALQNYLNNLDDSKVYSILFIATGITVNNSIINNNVISDSSMLVTKDYPINTLVNVVYLFIDKYLSHYLPSNFNESGIYSLIVKEKVWIDDNVYGKDKFFTIKNKIISSANKEFKKIEKTISLTDKFKNLKICGIDLKYNVVIEKSLYLNKNINMSFKEFIESLHNKQVYKVNYQNEVFTFRFSCISYNDNQIIRKVNVYSDNERLLISWVDVMKLSYKLKEFKKLDKWVRMSCEFNNLQVVERTIGSIKYSWSENNLMIEDYIKNKRISINNIPVDIDDSYRLNRIIQSSEDINIYENYRVNYNLNFVEELKGDNIFDSRIGAYDFETRTNDKGLQEVYSGCWRAGDYIESYFLGESGVETPDKLINKMFKDMFLKGFEGYKFYAHNGKNFDSHFIPSALLRNKDRWNELEIKMIKDENNANIELKIFNSKIDGKGNKKKVCISLWDSLSILPLSLDKIGKVFNLGKDGKKIYPYEFVNKYGIDYKGNVPSIKWFVNASNEDYNELINEYKDREWSVKEYTKLYVTSDVNILYNCLINFGKKVYNEFGVNITKRKTISGLTMLVYQSSFLNINKDKIAILPKSIDSIIRRSYTGGQVQVGAHSCEKAYYYDMNAQYSSILTMDMPVGNPVLISTNKLEECFGFVFAKITAPSAKELTVPILSRRREDGIVYQPHGETWEGLYWSGELENAIENKYKVEVKSCFQFEKGRPFEKYINHLYNMRLIAKGKGDSVMDLIYKLLSNSFYGRWGMRTEFDTTQIIHKELVDKKLSKYHWKMIHDIENTDYCVLKTGKTIDMKLLNDGDNFDKELENLLDSNRRGPVSNVAIASAVAAMARVSISKFKNIPGNPLIYSDTDSAVLPYPLDPSFIGFELGKMKLEYTLSEGIFIGSKLYGIKGIDSKGKEIIRIASAGINNTLLSYEDLKSLFKGNSITKVMTKFNARPELSSVQIDTDIKFTLKGLSITTPISLTIQEKIENLEKMLVLSKYKNMKDKKTNSDKNKKHVRERFLGDNRPKPNGFNYIKNPVNKKGFCTSQNRNFSTDIGNEISENVVIDNTKSNEFINRENTFYKVYHIATDNKFDTNIKGILEDMYDNNEFVIFNMYFMILPEKADFKIDIKNFLSHMMKYDPDVLNDQIVKVFKNVGMVLAKYIIVWLSLYDDKNLMNISKDIRIQMINNINQINQTIHEDFNNSTLNFNQPINLEKDEIFIIIGANFDIMKDEYENWKRKGE